MKLWKTASRRRVLDYPPYLSVEVHDVTLPSGRRIADWTWVITPDYVSIVVCTDDDRFLCFRQEKYGFEGLSLAPVGGYLEPGENALQAARRELKEEAGYEASEWQDLGTYVVDTNRGAGNAYFYLARGARKVCEPTAPDEEQPELLLLSRPEIEQALDSGDFKGLGWAAVFALALRKLPILSEPRPQEGVEKVPKA